MKRRLLIAAAVLSTLLAGCSINIRHEPCVPCGMDPGTKGDPTKPAVLIVKGEIQVDQPVLRFKREQTNVTITWTLPKGYSFPAQNGIVFESSAADEIVDCKRAEDPAVYTCLNKHTRPAYFKYGINANAGDKPLKPLDPFVWNE